MKTLTPNEARVLGTLMEKARTVPDSYPLSLNSLVLGCNQKSSREPVMALSDDDVREALVSLKAQSVVFEASSSRVPRYEHNVYRSLSVTDAQAAVLGLLLLRGPQTPAELRTSGERWYKFASPQEVEQTLAELDQRGLDGGWASVVKLPRLHGAREQRWMHLLCGAIDVESYAQTAVAPANSDDTVARLTTLENQVALLKADNAHLRLTLNHVCDQLGIALPKQSE